MDELLMNVGRFFKRQILFQRMEVNMSHLMDLLRGPALGVIVMIILLAGAIIITAFAALIAQMSLLLRLRPWNTSEKQPEGVGSETGKGDNPPEPYEQRSSAHESRRASSPDRQRSPSEHPRRGQLVVVEPNANEVIDAVWWETVR
jgi:hypothetical protein